MEKSQSKQRISSQSATHRCSVRIDSGETVISVWPQPAPMNGGLYLRVGKRIVDTVGALVGLVVISPVLLACAFAVRLDSRGPIFYRQQRVGQYGRTFRILKFRTMIHGTDKQGSKLTASGDTRITRVGRILRKTKLDELPQLLNVVRGEMSLVGPRPEVPKYTAKYTPQERRILDFRPGITGPASLAYIDEERLLASAVDQEKFYVNTIMQRKLQFDLAYCRKVCFLEDIKLIFRTTGSLVGLRSSSAEKACAWGE